ncbi:MAG: 4'-phosphopantetheinyl transferase superfamily protein [Acidobacteria bacterium]|nr:4'-phosphopantetheinyl transferase superfamily protein [Acidobacteriota bacterium]
MAELHVVRLLAAEEFQKQQNRLLTRVSSKRVERCRRFRNAADVQRSLLGELLVRAVLCVDHGFSNAQLVFDTDARGKPYLAGMTGLHFNVSHSGEWVAVAISPLPVGVDVEAVRGVDLAVARRFFAPEEMAWLLSRTPVEQAQAFYQLWTAKESVLKNLGQGLQLPLDRILIRGTAPDRLRLESRLDQPLPDLFLRLYQPAPDAILALCSREPCLPADIRQWSVSSLLNNIR